MSKCLIRDRIIVLKIQPFSESDLIVRGINTKGCQISFMAKGALKSKKRFTGGVLDPTAYIGLEYYHSRTSSLHRLKNAWFLDDFYRLRQDYHRLELAFYFLKVMNEISQEGTEDTEELFHLLGNALKLATTSPDLNSLKLFFQVKVLFLQGVLPENMAFPEILKGTLKQHQDFKMQEDKKNLFLSKLDQILQHYLTM